MRFFRAIINKSDSSAFAHIGLPVQAVNPGAALICKVNVLD
jgi:hypothetical protein